MRGHGASSTRSGCGRSGCGQRGRPGRRAGRHGRFCSSLSNHVLVGEEQSPSAEPSKNYGLQRKCTFVHAFEELQALSTATAGDTGCAIAKQLGVQRLWSWLRLRSVFSPKREQGWFPGAGGSRWHCPCRLPRGCGRAGCGACSGTHTSYVGTCPGCIPLGCEKMEG